MEHLGQVWHASRERLPFRTPGSVPIVGLACAPIVETRFLEPAMYLLDFSPRIPLGTFSILLPAMAHLLDLHKCNTIPHRLSMLKEFSVS